MQPTNKFFALVKNFLKFTLQVAIILLPLFGFASAEGQSFQINNFEVEVEIKEDSSLLVIEKIDVEFLREQRRIFKTIPTHYNDKFGLVKRIFIDNISVTDETNNHLPFTKTSNSGILSLKIGDPNIFINGEQSYVVTYSVKNAFTFFENTEELFWNAIGTAWQAPILSASASIKFPPTFQETRAIAFLGELGSTNQIPTSIANNEVSASAQNLAPYEGLSVAVSWPKGTLSVNNSELWKFNALSNWWIFIPILILILTFWYIVKFSIDPKGRGTIVPEFSIPKEVNLLELAVLRDEKLQNRDLVAMIISWAVDGFINIKEEKNKILLFKFNEFTLIKKKNLTNKKQYEIDFFNAIFQNKTEVKISQISATKIDNASKKLKESVFSSLKNKGYIFKNPITISSTFYVIGGMVCMVAFVVFASYFYNVAGILATGLLFISGISLILLAPIAPKRTHKGVLLKEKIEGFELYLKTAEKYRIKWQEKERIFEKYLPVAIALGVATIWAGHFKDKLTKSPEWYSGYAVGQFNIVNFTKSINNNFSTAVNSSISQAASRTGGSGFSGGGSGGGVGGGGGGSW